MIWWRGEAQRHNLSKVCESVVSIGNE
jgi:hypothetical protein